MLLAAGNLVRVAVGQLGIEAHRSEKLQQPFFPTFQRPPFQPCQQADVLGNRHVRETAAPPAPRSRCGAGNASTSRSGTGAAKHLHLAFPRPAPCR